MIGAVWYQLVHSVTLGVHSYRVDAVSHHSSSKRYTRPEWRFAERGVHPSILRERAVAKLQQLRGVVNMNLNKAQIDTLRLLAAYPAIWFSPTEIGERAGDKPPQSASSWGSSQAKALNNLGLCDRSSEGRYRVNTAGINAAETLEEMEGAE